MKRAGRVLNRGLVGARAPLLDLIVNPWEARETGETGRPLNGPIRLNQPVERD